MNEVNTTRGRFRAGNGKVLITARIQKKLFQVISVQSRGHWQDPVTWYWINFAGTQDTQWDLKSKGTRTSPSRLSFVLNVPLCDCVTCLPTQVRTRWPDPAKGLFRITPVFVHPLSERLQKTYIISSDQLLLFLQPIIVRQKQRSQELRVHLKNWNYFKH